ncbi:MAG: hypothetical protein H0X38_17620 [Planctomycetes bacterium]|nr:hypothetical protein [Planctomycetota bacterium]
MSGGTNSSSSKIAAVVVIIPLLILAWFAAPWILPMWRWQSVDWALVAKQNDMSEGDLRREFDFMVRFKPRGKGDPAPFQIVSMSPTWKSVDPKNMNEHEPPLLVRCTVVNDHDGSPINGVWISVNSQENYFKLHGWRFPPGTLGKAPKRPVVLYQGMSMSKVDLNTAIPLDAQLNSAENDDHMRRRDDGWMPP